MAHTSGQTVGDPAVGSRAAFPSFHRSGYNELTCEHTHSQSDREIQTNNTLDRKSQTVMVCSQFSFC